MKIFIIFIYSTNEKIEAGRGWYMEHFIFFLDFYLFTFFFFTFPDKKCIFFCPPLKSINSRERKSDFFRTKLK